MIISNQKLCKFLQYSSTKISEDLDRKIKLTPINNTSIAYWEENWEKNSSRTPPNGGWDWNSHYLYSQRRKVKLRYSLAIWYEEILCGMALGYASKGSAHLRIDLIEGAPDNNHPLRGSILPIIVDVSMDYALIEKKQKLIIANPVPDLIDIYSKMGFTYYPEQNRIFKKESFCEREVCYECS
ncbi:MAG: hypothetical protein D3903_09285 [Candidatus Electrothrix sp. GM3_4]|nr:hypothetical protein [Candidatus Electrothrix sp. GM3_4]